MKKFIFIFIFVFICYLGLSAQTNITKIISLPLSLVNGGFGVDYSNPNPVLKQSKDMGTAAANGGFAATGFVRVTVGAGQIARGRIEYLVVASDGTHLSYQGGIHIITCSQETSGGLVTQSKSTVGAQNFTGANSTVGSLAVGTITWLVTTGVGTCDFTVAETITTGTATSNILYWEVWPIGQGTWAAI